MYNRPTHLGEINDVQVDMCGFFSYLVSTSLDLIRIISSFKFQSCLGSKGSKHKTPLAP